MEKPIITTENITDTEGTVVLSGDSGLKNPTGIDLEGSYNNTGNSHIDRWAGGGGNYYNSLSEALSHVPEVKRAGTTVVILNDETGEKEEWHWPNPNNLTDSGARIKFPIKEINQRIDSVLPIGTRGQVLRIDKDNSRSITPVDFVTSGNYVSSDEELNESKLTIISQEDVFNSWFRFSHGVGIGGNPLTYLERSDKIPGIPLQTNSWSYDDDNDLIRSTQNTASHIGFVSSERLSKYSLSATLSSTSDDNDRLGLVIAFIEDSSDMVPNNAYGLDESDFSWGIDTESELIPNQHTLTVFRNRELFPRTVAEREHSFFVVYNFGKNDEKIIAWNDNAWPTPPETTAGDQWHWDGAEVDMKVVRDGDIVTIYSSDCSDSPNGKSGLIHEIVVDLTSDPVLEKFRGPHRFGFSAQSQPLATFSNLEFTNTENEIYDLRNGDVWVVNSGEWVLDYSRKLYDEVLPKSLVYNPKFNNLYYIESNGYAKINRSIDLNSDDFYTDTVGEEKVVRIKRYSSIRMSSTNNFSPSITGTTPFMVLEDSFEWKGTYISAFKVIKIKVWGFVKTDEGSILTLQLHSGDSSGTAGVGISSPTETTVFLLEIDIHIRSNTQSRTFLKLTSGGGTTEYPSKHAVNMSNFDRAFNTDIPIGVQGSFSVSGVNNQCLIRSYEVVLL